MLLSAIRACSCHEWLSGNKSATPPPKKNNGTAHHLPLAVRGGHFDASYDSKVRLVVVACYRGNIIHYWNEVRIFAVRNFLYILSFFRHLFQHAIREVPGPILGRGTRCGCELCVDRYRTWLGSVSCCQYRYTISYPKFWKPKSSENRKFFSWRSSEHQSSRLGQTCPDATHAQPTPRRCVASRSSKLGLELHPAGCVNSVSELLPVRRGSAVRWYFFSVLWLWGL
jgi:hypothetical protein